MDLSNTRLSSNDASIFFFWGFSQAKDAVLIKNCFSFSLNNIFIEQEADARMAFWSAKNNSVSKGIFPVYCMLLHLKNAGLQ